MEKTKIDLINNVIKTDDSILAVYLFGSQAKDKSNKYSDIDIAILLDDRVKKQDYTERRISLATDLARILNKEFDVVVLNQASLFLRFQVIKEGKRIYERPDRKEHTFEAQAIMQYLDFLQIKNRIENAIIAKIKGA